MEQRDEGKPGGWRDASRNTSNKLQLKACLDQLFDSVPAGCVEDAKVDQGEILWERWRHGIQFSVCTVTDNRKQFPSGKN